MKKIYFALPGNEKLTAVLVQKENAEKGIVEIRQFPDDETYVRIHSDVKNKKVILVCSLNNPDTKILPLYFIVKTAKKCGAESICLIAPYLAYMRQDKEFKPGESVTSSYFAELISGCIDELITVDPHLHRRKSLAEIYSIPTQVRHATIPIVTWIQNHVENPILIGPDSESEQWVSEVAQKANAPYKILTKTRRGDFDVAVSIPNMDNYKSYTPVILDDIISTGRTLMETIQQLKTLGMKPAVCIGVHALFVADAFEELQKTGAQAIVSCNTIAHESNQIDISNLLLPNFK